jgi:hypothetical protein
LHVFKIDFLRQAWSLEKPTTPLADVISNVIAVAVAVAVASGLAVAFATAARGPTTGGSAANTLAPVVP